MLSHKEYGRTTAHSHGLLWQFYRWLRGTEQILVRPAGELPLILISYSRGDYEGVKRLKASLEETWPTLPDSFRQRYFPTLKDAPPLIVVLLRRRNICTCLGHHHPEGTESRITRRLRNLSGVRTGELDLAFEAIRDWEPLPLSHLALPPETVTEETTSFQWQLALLAVLLHELHHLVHPQEPEYVVRRKSQSFYEDVLAHYLSQHFHVEYGLRRDVAASVGNNHPDQEH